MIRFLVTAGAAALLAAPLATPVAAQQVAADNEAFVGQVGDSNELLIVQDGRGNRVGDTAGGTPLTFADTFLVRFGIALDDVTRFFVNQIGDGNAIDVAQTGFANRFGANEDIQDPNLVRTLEPTGVNQMGDGNTITVDQYAAEAGRASGTGNTVVSVAQGAPDGAGPALSANTLTIRQGLSAANALVDPVPVGAAPDGGHQVGVVEQRGDGSATNTIAIAQTGAGLAGGVRVGSFVGQITQEGLTPGSFGAGNAATIVQTGSSNALSIARQEGASNALDLAQDGTGNALNRTRQTGAGNAIDVTLSGAANKVEQIRQDSTAGTVGNSASVTLIGESNGFENAVQAGVGAFQGLLDGLATDASGVGVLLGTVFQIGGANQIAYNAGGDANVFGFTQEGDGNQLTANATGIANQIGVLQIGDGNTLDARQTTPGRPYNQQHFNAIGASQVGERNAATLDQDGAFNRLALTVRGDDNAVTSRQTLDANDADVAILGDANVLDLVQAGLDGGVGNRIVATIAGNRNNATSLAASLGGFDAALTAGLSPLSAPFLPGDLAPGRIVQRGDDNAVTLDVTGDANRFAVLQGGSRNVATGTVAGSNNQALVVQVGNGNTADFSQTGTGHRVRILQ